MSILSSHRDTFCIEKLPAIEDWPEFLYEKNGMNYPERINIATVLLDDTVNALGPDRPCLLEPNDMWTYGHLLATANQIAHILINRYAIVPGNRVVLRGVNSAWLVACWFAVLKVGAVAVTTMHQLRTADIQKIIDKALPSLIITDHAQADEVIPFRNSIPVVEYGSDADDDLTQLASMQSSDFTNVDTYGTDVAILAPTSGTTGKPKITAHFHRDFLAITDSFCQFIVKPESDDIFTGTPPLAFTFGLLSVVVFPLKVGAAVLLLPPSSTNDFVDNIARFGATIIFTAPTVYRAIIKNNLTDHLSGVKRCISAGENLPTVVREEFFQKTGITIIDGLGGTELLHIYISASETEIKSGSIGKILPGFEVAIFDRDEITQELPPGALGLLAVKGITGCRYLDDAENQHKYVKNGWNFTGDICSIDEEGYIFYRSRSDDMIISSGYNISALEVEDIINQHPDVTESAVVGLADADRGNIIHAAIVLRPEVQGDAAKIREIQEFVKSNTAPYKYPRSVVFVESLPKNPSGKIQRFKLKPQ